MEDTARASDNIATRLKDIREDINPIYKELNNILTVCAILIISMILFCIFPFMVYIKFVIGERILFASVGILTFISIFYSLFQSKESKTIIKSLEKLLKLKGDEFRKVAIEKIEKTEDTKQITKEMDTIKKELKRIDTITDWLDLEYTLLFTVILLIMAIVLSIVNVSEFYILSYTFFAMGVSLTTSIVLMWRLLGRMARKHKLV